MKSDRDVSMGLTGFEGGLTLLTVGKAILPKLKIHLVILISLKRKYKFPGPTHQVAAPDNTALYGARRAEVLGYRRGVCLNQPKLRRADLSNTN